MQTYTSFKLEKNKKKNVLEKNNGFMNIWVVQKYASFICKNILLKYTSDTGHTTNQISKKQRTLPLK